MTLVIFFTKDYLILVTKSSSTINLGMTSCNAIKKYDDDLYSLIANYDKVETPAKIIRLLEIIKESNNGKIVIWAHFIKTIKLTMV